jgi:hypothetical protein
MPVVGGRPRVIGGHCIFSHLNSISAKKPKTKFLMNRLRDNPRASAAEYKEIWQTYFHIYPFDAHQ